MSNKPNDAISIKEVLNLCIRDLGHIKVEVDQLETVIIPIRKVQDTLRALAQAVWEPGDPPEKMPESMKKIEEPAEEA